MAPTVLPLVAMKWRMQEKPMPANQPQVEVNQLKPVLSLKAQAAAEEAEAAALKKISDDQQAPPITDPNDPGFISLSEIASQGYDALHEAYRRQQAVKPKEIPPPELTPRQRARLEEEMAAGAAAVARAAIQQANRPVPERDKGEGFNTPVFRPGEHVPPLNARDPAMK